MQICTKLNKMYNKLIEIILNNSNILLLMSIVQKNELYN